MSSRPNHGQGGVSPSVVALLLVVTIVAASAGLFFLMAGEAEPEVQQQPPVEKVNPFEGLPPETPPAK